MAAKMEYPKYALCLKDGGYWEQVDESGLIHPVLFDTSKEAEDRAKELGLSDYLIVDMESND